jgi:DNA-binding NarL/FixJ family response regulator
VSNGPVRVLLADDQAMVRAGFRMIIESQPDLTVVAEADNGRTAVELAQRFRPEVCLLDIRMPGLDGLAATCILAGPGVPKPLPVVIATTFDSEEYVESALRNGAVGFILQDSGPQLPSGGDSRGGERRRADLAVDHGPLPRPDHRLRANGGGAPAVGP